MKCRRQKDKCPNISLQKIAVETAKKKKKRVEEATSFPKGQLEEF
jgi:hypothetical protein